MTLFAETEKNDKSRENIYQVALVESFETYSASIATESYRTDWNWRVITDKKGNKISYKHFIHSTFIEKTFPFLPNWLSGTQ